MQSPLLEANKDIPQPQYSPDEQTYMHAQLALLTKAKEDRDQKHPEFDNRSYIEEYQTNERIANSRTPEKKQDDDTTIPSGTVEQKLITILSEVHRLNLSPEILAFDTDNTELVGLGKAMTDIDFKTSEWDSDKEKKLQRQLELLKQGQVFLQENWVKEFKQDKQLIKGAIGSIEGVEWANKLIKVYEGPRRSILYGPGVYLGDIRQPQAKLQPIIFTRKVSSYAEVKSRYGQKKDGKDVWERWKHVPKQIATMATTFSIGQPDFMLSSGWSLGSLGREQVEEIHVQNRWENELQIYLNGVPMLPVGFPLAAISPNGDYNIDWQILQYINPFFAYGRSFAARVAKQADILDEVIKLLNLKFRKSIHPPYANQGPQVITRKALSPGAITMGINAQALQPIGQEGQGITNAEFAWFQALQEQIDNNTVSKQLQGQQSDGKQTAFEVSTLMRQAQKLLVLVIFACKQLEVKGGYLRLFNNLENFFKPTGTKLDEENQQVISAFRSILRNKVNIESEGEGMRQIIPMIGQLPTSEEVRNMEVYEGAPQVSTGQHRPTRVEAGLPPLEKIFLNPEELRNVKIHWYVDADTREEGTSNMGKLMFREELNDIVSLMNLGSVPNLPELEQEYARVWGKRKDKVFSQRPQTPLMPQDMDVAGANQKGAPAMSPMTALEG